MAHLRIALAVPRRDWRFWASIAAAMLLVTVCIAFTQILSDRNHWRNRFDRQSTEQLCRSAAGAGVSAAQADLLGQMADNQFAIDAGLVAVANGDREALGAQVAELEARATAVSAARSGLDAAIIAQQEALRTCQPEPAPITVTEPP